MTPNIIEQYTKDHEWVKIENGDTAVVGITEYAQHALGDLVYVELPKMGAQYKKGAYFAVVESVKTAAEVYTPVSGEIIAVNDALAQDAELLKDAENGWIVKIKITDQAELDGLMDKAQYDEYLTTIS
ncbi:MAG: glycine cleavage system protein GcvH [Micavibrio aeruginosavorus]|uniref:Glycine cleavage system H protein n=1 Tax=Micavibrio aeruginosavorus TaxID=349221 RepID=A0A2W5HMK0_9BACT|nr:MAG: glycine cleavage system protein GcvH [Micavibrio aeruginosavorus]